MTQYVMEMLSFAAVAEQGGFTAAARKLTLSKGLISQHVKRLEELSRLVSVPKYAQSCSIPS